MTYSLWMLTTQLPSVPRTWCPPTILVFMCTKHDILGPLKARREDMFYAACWMDASGTFKWENYY